MEVLTIKLYDWMTFFMLIKKWISSFYTINNHLIIILRTSKIEEVSLIIFV